MKTNLKILINVVFVFVIAFAFYSCDKDKDLMTKDALEGGLVNVLTTNAAYKLGNTPSIKIDFEVPIGPGISKLHIYKTFTAYDSLGAAHLSNTAEMTVKDVNSANLTEIVTGFVTATYADLRSGLTVDGTPLPSDETLLNIGDKWTLNYVSEMADGRLVTNNAKTTIAVANLYAGNYQCDGYFSHPTPASCRPINEEKYMVPLTAYTCETHMADLFAAYGYTMKVIVNPADNTVTVKELGATSELHMNADTVSTYNPSSGVFKLYYYYVGGSGNRVIRETYTPIP